MSDQLSAAFPIHTYPHVLVAPDGGVVVSAGKLLVKYSRSGPSTFQKEFSYASRPGHPWSYPQTGEPRRRGRGGRQVPAPPASPAHPGLAAGPPCVQPPLPRGDVARRGAPSSPPPPPRAGVGVLLPIQPPYDKLFFLAAGGSADDRADYSTPASKAAEIIEVRRPAGSRAQPGRSRGAAACRGGQHGRPMPPTDMWGFHPGSAAAASACVPPRRRRPLHTHTHTHLLLQLTAGPEATWESVGPMPYGRVMGDAVILCDGTIGFFGGSQVGVAVSRTAEGMPALAFAAASSLAWCGPW